MSAQIIGMCQHALVLKPLGDPCVSQWVCHFYRWLKDFLAWAWLNILGFQMGKEVWVLCSGAFNPDSALPRELSDFELHTRSPRTLSAHKVLCFSPQVLWCEAVRATR